MPTRAVLDQVQPGASYQVLYSFGRSRYDAGRPAAGLADVKDTLNGATPVGGKYTGSSCPGFGGCGTVFRISTTGQERVLYSFRGRTNGIEPAASLVDENDTLYGTTTLGGKYHHGTIFSVSLTGKERLLYSFSGGADGSYPVSPLIDVNGTLCGTAGGGGSSYRGTLFSITTSGQFNVLHRFQGSPDGADPTAGLIVVKGLLYGTTAEGGKYSSYNGTVFRSTTSGIERVVHSFAGGSDGADPTASLIDVKGTLYGATSFGGAHSICSGGCGTVFALTP
jgi:uncharacterized repeat protein (TIGR03803 family)